MWMNPILLAGIAGALAPLILHLLSRSRGRTVPWAAMMFLCGPDGKPDRSPIRRTWTLLILRMMTIGCLAVALARPIVRGRIDPRETRPSTMVLIIDCSSSMARGHAGHTRLELARDAARQALWSVEKNARVALVAIGHEARIVTEPTTNLQDIARELDRLNVMGGEADMLKGLDAAGSIFEKSDPGPREIFLVTDRQSFNWENVRAESPSLRWLSRPDYPARFFVVPVGGVDVEGLMILPIEAPNHAFIRGTPQTLEIRVRNYSPTPRAGVEIALSSFTTADPRARLADMRKIASVKMDIPANGIGVARAPLAFDREGSIVLSARIESTPIDAGARRDVALEVMPQINVLILTGDDPADRDRSAEFIRLALTPRDAAGLTGDPAKVDVEPMERLDLLDFTRYAVFIVANPPLVDEYLASRLEQAAYRGAGVILFPGNLTRVDNFNQKFWRHDSGLSPAQLKPPVDGSASLLGLDMQHPVFSFIKSGDSPPPDLFQRYFQAAPGYETQVLATFTTGEPFLMERTMGRGKVILAASPPDLRWSQLPRNAIFPPMMQSAARFLASSTTPSRNLVVGGSLSASFDEAVDRVMVIRDDDVPMINQARVSQVRIGEVVQPGIYRVISWARGQQKITHFVVSDSIRESDPTLFDAAKWASIRNELGFVELDPSARAIGPILNADRRGTELWMFFLIAAATLGAAEQLLTRFWSCREAE